MFSFKNEIKMRLPTVQKNLKTKNEKWPNGNSRKTIPQQIFNLGTYDFFFIPNTEQGE